MAHPIASVLPGLTAVDRSIDALGCATHRLHKSREIRGDGIMFYRRGTDDGALGKVATPASDRGFLIGVSMGSGHRRTIRHEHHSATHDFAAHSIYVRSFADDYRADLRGAFDFLLMEISPDSLARAIEERSGPRVRSLECVTGLHDPVLAHLALALAPSLERPEQASDVFVDQMGVVIETYLIEHYGGGRVTAPRRRKALSVENERRAKDMLLSRLDGRVSIASIADECRLSRSYFIRAFRDTTGHTPHQWLQLQRIERARHLMSETGASLSEIASACGFADQSHFTRVFSQITGATPGRWQRAVSA